MTGEVFVFEGAGIGAYLSFNNNERPHQALERRTPAQVFEEGRNQVRQPELNQPAVGASQTMVWSARV